MSRIAVLLTLYCMPALTAELPSVSLESGDWVCSEGTSIMGGVATLEGEPKRYPRVTLTLPASRVAGKRLRLSAEVKTSGLKSESPVVYASPKLKIADADGKALGVNNFGTKDRSAWEELMVEAAIPKDWTSPIVLELGLQYCSGSLQVRSVQLEEALPWKWQVLDADETTHADSAAVEPRPSGERRNVLFIAVDDLKPQLGCYGANQMLSPNLDRLAAGGMMFTRTYCQQAVCSPSRTSLLTGLRPDSTQVYDLTTHFRENVPDVVTLPQNFALHGYATLSMGKIYHGGLDDRLSWTMPTPKFGGRGYISQAVLADQAKRRREGFEKGLRGVALYNYSAGPPVECADVADNAYRDGALADAARTALKTLAAQDQPFFLAVGFYKPHLPFNAPKRYWDLYDREKVSLATNPEAPEGAPAIAMHNFGELRSYQGIPKKGKLAEAQARELVHGYYACVSFVDAQIGKVVDELERLGLSENTIVIVWGDHGWHLGDHGLWCKHTNFESAARVPMIIRVPGAESAGRSCHALTEFVDIYPSLCDLAGIPTPPHVEGTSFAALIQDPDRDWKRAAFSQYPRGSAMGYSMRTDRYRYTEWLRPGGEIEAVELYDHQNDPQENINLGVLPQHENLLKNLGMQLHQGWRAAGPSRQ
jgi:iduronate 2-sulfatase